MKCWSCGTENELQAVQTCAACGAPLVKGHGVFSKATLFAVLVLGLLCQAVCMASHWLRR